MSAVSQERLDAVLHDARVGMFAAMVDDRDALGEAIERGLVERSYEGAAGLMGLATLRLTQRGEAA